MKKIFTLISACMLAIGAMAQTEYTDDMYVTVNDVTSDPIPATIVVTPQGDNKYTLSLKNFILTSEDGDMPVGNVEVSDIEAVDCDGYKSLVKTADINITEGDLEDVDFWLGPMICAEGPITVDINAKMSDTRLYALITIDLTEMLGQSILVTFSEDEFPTGIKSVSVSESDGCFYNIAGQRVAANAKGLVINNGKKFINK